MQFTRIQLDSFKCFVDESIELQAGVTAMYGANGAGKTSLLEGCFFALYGADALPSGKNLADVIEKGEDEAVVELWFEHDGNQYHVRRQVREYETQTDHDVTLTTPDGPIEDPGPVDDAIEDLFRLDADAFLNCAYVRQGDINKLITASPSDRQDMIDQLLQLGKLDRYENRMGMIRNGIESVKDAKEGTLEGVKSDIDALEDRELEQQLERVESELDEIGDEISTLDDRIAPLEDERREANEELESLQELESQINDLETEHRQVRSNLGEERKKRVDLGNERNQYVTQIASCESTAADHLEETSVESLDLDAVKSRIEEIDRRLDQIKTARDVADERVSEFQDAVEEAKTTAGELESDADDLEGTAQERRQEADEKESDLSDPRGTLENVESELGDIEKRFAQSSTTRDAVESYMEEKIAELEAIRGELEDLRGKLRTARDSVGHARLLLIRGRCPECGQEVEDAPNVSSYEEDRDKVRRLKREIQDKESEVAAKEGTVEEARSLADAAGRYESLESRKEDLRREIRGQSETIEALREEANELEEEATTKRVRAAYNRTAIPHLEALADRAARARAHLTDEMESLDTEQRALSEAQEVLSEADQKHRERDRIDERLEEDVDPQIDHWRNERDRVESELEGTREELDPGRIQRLERRRDGAARWQSVLEQRRADLESRQGELRSEKGGINEALNELSRKREQRDTLSDQIDRLETGIHQCEAAEQMYRDLREDLRTRNVDELERLLNELFDLLYQTDSYAHFELSDSYELTVYEKSGEALDPTDLSGGERALFNLALRCAIYQLLTEGLSGRAPLPPLILDEPTVYLDEQHINELSGLITRMRELGVDQIILVSHQEELVDAAGERIEIRQDSTTNRSHVRVESRDLLA